MAHEDRRSVKWSAEVVALLAITIIGWATNAGMTHQHMIDMDRRLEKVEQKLDMVLSGAATDRSDRKAAQHE